MIDAGIYAGIGLRQTADGATVLAAIDLALHQHGHDRKALAALASHPQRRHHPALQQAAAVLDVPLVTPDGPALAGQPTMTRSPEVERRLQLGSVAEAAALAACVARHGRCRLLASRLIDPTRLVTVALAVPASPDLSFLDPS